MKTDDKLISILIPLFNEEENLKTLLQTLEHFCSQLPYRFEILFVDDGSSDNTWTILEDYTAKNFSRRALQFSRNFGKETALMAGIFEVRGDAVVVMDADLQHPIEVVHEFLVHWSSGEFAVVEGVKSHRGRESILYRFLTGWFYWLLTRWSGHNLKNSTDFKLLDRKVINSLKKLPERNLLFRGLVHWLGFPSKQIPFEIQNRRAGDVSMSLASRVELAKNSITSFSAKPLRLVIRIAILFLLVSIFLITQTIYKKVTGHAVEGFTTVIILQLIIGGITLMSLGIIGEYLSQVYQEVKGRPRFIISDEL